ncbi:P-loop containing nucleoside triphosphate hydrolase protein [Dimargaris cristalligena]|uniref:P-loop containing nucleoside triphosphate hydrolase protein n=1 Tax=Dimargaris cristalligena TaxID=215637 RepID=A0A4P9ZWX3_9FUNG|nr:P-loop containing nucleoside triphosphate hydrolase protein [Dimargaris cristalligena]|eukprot:RKP38176.1 P-loop containing nucleoside triphosphate hydrolase protein [Dimargaris cristalligena]
MDDIINELQQQSFYADQIVPRGHKTLSPRPALFSDHRPRLDARVYEALKSVQGITNLYTHQCEAIEGVLNGGHIIISTSTASADPDACALCVFPTKALSQDQIQSFRNLISACAGLTDIQIGVYDGDTPYEGSVRNTIRQTSRVIVTNPDMLHMAILPHHSRWQRLLRHVRYIVLDELHTYHGSFGANVGFILRRLRRLCAQLGNTQVQFIACSATLAQPIAHMEELCGFDSPPSAAAIAHPRVLSIDQDGSPCGSRDYILWNPRGETQLSDTEQIIAYLMRKEVKSMVFCKSRRVCELLFRKTLDTLKKYPSDASLANKVFAYRGGVLAGGTSANRSMVITTNALELGINVGSLDAVVMVGAPSSFASFRQQAGRAGRRNQGALGLVVLDPDDPRDQRFVHHPEYLLNAPVKDEWELDLTDPGIKVPHLQCAAYEAKLQDETDTPYFGTDMEKLCVQHLLSDVDQSFICHPTYRPYPAALIDIRGPREEQFGVIDVSSSTDRVLEELEASRAQFSLYEGGIFIHQAKFYLMTRVIPDKQAAFVKPSHLAWYSTPHSSTFIEIKKTLKSLDRSGDGLAFGSGQVVVTVRTTGFSCIDFHKGQVINTVEKCSPDIAREAYAIWINLPPRVYQQTHQGPSPWLDSLHALYHLFSRIAPRYLVFSNHSCQYEMMQVDNNSSPPLSGLVPETCKTILHWFDIPSYTGYFGIAERGRFSVSWNHCEQSSAKYC